MKSRKSCVSLPSSMLKFAMAVNCSFLTNLWVKYGGRVRKFVRFAVLLACTVVVCIQLTECFSKLFSPPVSSLLRIVVNKSMTYPAITICRFPSYKPDVLHKYNLQNVRVTSDWDDFPYGKVALKEFWDESTYKVDEVHKLSALSSYLHHVRIESRYYLIWGQCHTILPLIQTTTSGKEAGYSVILYQQEALYNRSDEEPVDGWRIFIHPATDPWTENTHDFAGEEESLYLEVEEELNVKINVQEYLHVNKADDPCNSDPDYSFVKCEFMCKTRQLVNKVGCTGPWLPEDDFKFCSEYSTMRELLTGYINNLTCEPPCCNCIRPCRTLRYIPYIQKRQPIQTTEPNHCLSQLYLYYNSRLVQVAEERLAYDWSLFLSDLGGSLGFLLGLSVLGIIGIVERLIDLLYSTLQPPERKNALILVEDNVPRKVDKKSKLDVIEKMDCVCCRTTQQEEKSLSLYDMDTLRCKSKLPPQSHCDKY